MSCVREGLGEIVEGEFTVLEREGRSRTRTNTCKSSLICLELVFNIFSFGSQRRVTRGSQATGSSSVYRYDISRGIERG
jgi:hypothetical protein